ncbi:hypothetical protein [Evansella tamaricis]|uniref:Uncharacterized protein n=1 Tax=Evansella tamaricis TaxID=2069301 RepID=A0ABS6JH29_9BACI|nr:hypothetical protein [Evansella tamaricis]MBU9712982.1 hypothetical protein [Evansella tamaricis]
MHQTHGMGYAEYNLKLEKRLKVEREREKDHQKSIAIVSEHQRLVHSL